MHVFLKGDIGGGYSVCDYRNYVELKWVKSFTRVPEGIIYRFEQSSVVLYTIKIKNASQCYSELST